MSFLAIEWNPSIGIDLGFFVIRWYSLMFVTAFLLALDQKIMNPKNESTPTRF